jgi:cytochrome b6-f complex iron-sulfur subunit
LIHNRITFRIFRYAETNASINLQTLGFHLPHDILENVFMNMQRRSFLTYFTVGWAASCFPLVLSACTTDTKTETKTTDAKTTDTKPATDSKTTESKAPTETANAPDEAADKGGKDFTAVGTVAQLDKAGSVGNDKVLVIRNPTNKSKLLAVNPSCTHKGGIVKWKGDHFECPLHDADFAADGKVLKGPATIPLATFTAKIVGDKVMVKMA